MRRSRRRLSLFWRVFGTNAAVLTAAGLALALTPATVHSPITLGEAATLVAGVAAMLLINLVLLRRSFAPLNELTKLMRRVDPLRPGQRIGLDPYDRELADLVDSFNDMLDRVEGERRLSARRELEAQDANQRRIAAELHDEIGQRLTVLLLMLSRAQADAGPATAHQLQGARDLAHATLDNLRDLARGLRPEALDQLGITRALSALADNVAQGAGVTIDSHLERVKAPLPPVVALVIYRVAQESLTNAVRHAPGSPIELYLDHSTDGGVRVRVCDHGPGFSPPAPNGQGRGLRGMRERALLIGATLDIDSGTTGTSITLSVPAAPGS